MRVAVIHPLKHHVYYSMAGVMESGAEVIGLFGYYDKNDFLDKIVRKTKWKKQIDGYKYEKISKCVKTNLFVKALFLLAKAKPKQFQKLYDWAFETWVIHNLKGVDCIHVLQDYENKVIRVAKKRNIKIVYEQITSFDVEVMQCLKNEVKIAGFPTSYIETRYSQDKLDKQLENLKISDVIIAASKVTERSLSNYTDKIVYTFPYGAEQTISSEKMSDDIIAEKKAKKVLKVLCVSSISLIKGTRYVIRAAQRLEGEPFEFVFVGKPNRTEDSRLVEMIKEQNNCTYIQSVPHTEINSLYKEHDIFVFQGLCEGFGMVTLEAMANGLPCMVSTGGCGIITDGKDGFINDNGDVDKLTENLRTLMKDRDRLVQMGIEAKKSARKCTWEGFSSNIANVYRISFQQNS